MRRERHIGSVQPTSRAEQAPKRNAAGIRTVAGRFRQSIRVSASKAFRLSVACSAHAYFRLRPDLIRARARARRAGAVSELVYRCFVSGASRRLRLGWPKRVSNPAHCGFAVRKPVDPEYVEAAAVVPILRVLRKIDGRGPRGFALLASVNGADRVHPRAAAPITHLDEDQTPSVEHDEIDFAVPAVEVARDRLEPGALEFPEREVLGFVAAQSSSGSSHGSSSASSGSSNSPCSLMS